MTTTERTREEAHRDLAHLANFLDDLPHDRFHMPAWCSVEDATATSCGTAGCATGWAVTLFHSKGLYLKNIAGTRLRYPMYECGPNHYHGFVAFARFFRIPIADSKNICSPEEYDVLPIRITPEQVARRIREVLSRINPEALKEPTKLEPARDPVHQG